jgi:hypothetical protein
VAFLARNACIEILSRDCYFLCLPNHIVIMFATSDRAVTQVVFFYLRTGQNLNRNIINSAFKYLRAVLNSV